MWKLSPNLKYSIGMFNVDGADEFYLTWNATVICCNNFNDHLDCRGSHFLVISQWLARTSRRGLHSPPSTHLSVVIGAKPSLLTKKINAVGAGVIVLLEDIKHNCGAQRGRAGVILPMLYYSTILFDVSHGKHILSSRRTTTDALKVFAGSIVIVWCHSSDSDEETEAHKTPSLASLEPARPKERAIWAIEVVRTFVRA